MCKVSEASTPTDPPSDVSGGIPGPRSGDASGNGAELPQQTPVRSRWRAKAPWFGLALFCLLFDLVTKWWVFYPHAVQPDFREGLHVGTVCSGWDTILVYNNGITFGLLPSAGRWVLALGTGIVIAVLCWKLWTAPRGRKLESFALSIVIGGAIGNLYDRTVRPLIEADKNPGVRDFLDWYVPSDTAAGRWLLETFETNHWYTSNVADVIIVCGVILLAWCILREPATAPTPSEGDAAPQAESIGGSSAEGTAPEHANA